ncbi:MAG: rhomboid family intramembrane serine protease [Gemmatimonadales bacterium]
MSGTTSPTTPPPTRPAGLTPWVGRLLVVNATVALLLLTVLTAPAVQEVLRFESAGAVRRPWSYLSHMFVHGGLLPLALNLVLLNALGPALERRMGGGRFLLFYLYCGVATALFALGLAPFMTAAPLAGGTGAVLGVALAHAMLWPDAEVSLAPLPGRVGSKTLVFVVVVADLLAALAGERTLAHPAHLGGLAAAYIFLRVEQLGRQMRRPLTTPPPRRIILEPITVARKRPAEARPAPAPAARPEPRETGGGEPDELDRVLDKISASGIESLTVEERRFLADAAEKKRREVQ